MGSIFRESVGEAWATTTQATLRSGLEAAAPRTPAPPRVVDNREPANTATPKTERWAHLKRDVEGKVTETSPTRLRFDGPQSQRTATGAVLRGRHPRIDPFESNLIGSSILPKQVEVPSDLWAPTSTCPRPLPGDVAQYRLEQKKPYPRGWDRDPILDGEEHVERPYRRQTAGQPATVQIYGGSPDDLVPGQRRMLRGKPDYTDDCAGLRTDKGADGRRQKRASNGPIACEDRKIYNRKFTPLSHIPNPRDPILQDKADFDPGLARAESLRVYREKLQDRYNDPNREERDIFRQSPERRAPPPPEILMVDTGHRLFGHTAVDEAAPPKSSIRTAVPKPVSHESVIRYRHSAGISTDDYALRDPRSEERAEHADRMQDLARIKLEVDHVYNVIRARAEKTSKALREFLYDQPATAHARTILQNYPTSP